MSTKLIQFHLTEEQFAKLKAEADKETARLPGLSLKLGVFVRILVLRAIGLASPTPPIQTKPTPKTRLRR